MLFVLEFEDLLPDVVMCINSLADRKVQLGDESNEGIGVGLSANGPLTF